MTEPNKVTVEQTVINVKVESQDVTQNVTVTDDTGIAVKIFETIGGNISDLINDSGFIRKQDLSASGDLTYDANTGQFSVTTYKNFNTDFAAKSTTDLSEGVNKYYTVGRVKNVINDHVDKPLVDKLKVDAGTLDGIEPSKFVRTDISNPIIDKGNEKGMYQGWAETGDSRYLLAPKTSDGINWDWDKELWFNSTQGYWGVDTEFYVAGNKRAFHVGYHPNADKLTTARKITLSGDVAGETTFDGSGNVTINTTADSKVSKAGDTMTGPLVMNSEIRFQNEENRFTYNDGGGNFNMRFGNKFDGGEKYVVDNVGSIHMRFMYEGTNPEIQFILSENGSNAVAGNPVVVGRSFVMSHDGFFIGGQKAYTEGFHPLADKLTNSRKIALSGDVTGEVNFDGTSDVTINASVNNSVYIRKDQNSTLSDYGDSRKMYKGWASTNDDRFYFAPRKTDDSAWDWSREFWFDRDKDGGQWGVDTEFYIGSTKRAFHDEYHPNADTLTTPRNIALAGAVTGAVSFNGSQDVSITTVAKFPFDVSFNLALGKNATFPIHQDTGFGYTIKSVSFKTSSGTITGDIQINGTSVTGLNALAIASTKATATATGNNTVAKGATVSVVTTNNSAAEDVIVTLNCERDGT